MGHACPSRTRNTWFSAPGGLLPSAHARRQSCTSRAQSRLSDLGVGLLHWRCSCSCTAAGERAPLHVPAELSTDHMDLLHSMAGSGHITAAQAVAQLGWTVERTDAAMELLLERGLVWIDDQAAGGART